MTAAVDVSVVMGVYNGREEIVATLDSLFAQQEVTFEIVVVDDGSTDGSGDLLDGLAGKEPRLRVLHQQNAGLTAALRRGCSAAKGMYLARQDVGDLSDSRRLARQKAALDATDDVLMVSCWTRYIAPAGEELWIDRGRGLPDKPLSILDLSREWGVVGGPTHHGSVMMRRSSYEAVGGYRPDFYFGQDWDLWYRLAERGRFQLVSAVLYTARVAPNSISTGWRDLQTQLARLSLAALCARCNGGDEQPILARARQIRPDGRSKKSSRADGLYFIGEVLRRRGSEGSRTYLRQAIEARPWMLRAWIRLLQSIATRRSEPT